MKVTLRDILLCLKDSGYKITSEENNGGIRKWASGGDWEYLKEKCAQIGGQYYPASEGSMSEEQINGDNYTILKQRSGIHLHYTPKKNNNDNFNRKYGIEENKNIKMKDNSMDKVRAVLTNLLESVLKEEELTRPAENKLKKQITEYQRLQSEIEAAEAAFRKQIQTKENRLTKLDAQISSLMEQYSMEIYEVDGVIAKMSKGFDKVTPKYKAILEQLMTKLTGKMKTYANKLMKDPNLNVRSTYTPKLTIEAKTIIKVLETKYNQKVVFLNENILTDWIKTVWYSLKDLLNSIKSTKETMKQVLNHAGI